MASQFGALPPPAGVVPDFINPPSQQKENLVQHATCLTLVTMFVAMRIYTRLRILGSKLGTDDYFCILSYALDWTYSMLMITACSKGLGRHMWDVPAIQVPEALKYLEFAAFAYILLTLCIKLTFLFCYRRIFSLQSTTNTFVNLGIAFVICLNTSLFFATIFSCAPVERSWNAAVPGTCYNPHILPWFSTISSSLTDIYIFVLPIAPLWRLNMGPKRKLKVMVAFSFGLFACAASLVRLGMTPVLHSSSDATWTTASIGKWSALEVDIGIMCSCLVLLPAFLNHHLPESSKAYLSRFLDQVFDVLSSRSKTKSASFRRSENSWPSDKYQSMAEGKASTSIVRTQSFTLEPAHVHGDHAATTVPS